MRSLGYSLIRNPYHIKYVFERQVIEAQSKPIEANIKLMKYFKI